MARVDLGQAVKGVRNRFELQRNIRHNADDGKHGYQAAESLRFAVAARNKISDTDNVLFFADTDDFA